MDEKKFVSFLYEAGQLKRVKRSGWWLEGVKDPESVAEHSYRTAIIAYFLAKIENEDKNKIAIMCLFHDVHETRLNDMHKLAQRYIKTDEAENECLKEQFELLGEEGKEIHSLLLNFAEGKTKEAVIAKDADLLEDALTAKEYMDIGYKTAAEHLNRIKKLLILDSSKRILRIIESTSSYEWFKELKRLER
jgi:putative hydrolase of HD superfamily